MVRGAGEVRKQHLKKHVRVAKKKKNIIIKKRAIRRRGFVLSEPHGLTSGRILAGKKGNRSCREPSNRGKFDLDCN